MSWWLSADPSPQRPPSSFPLGPGQLWSSGTSGRGRLAALAGPGCTPPRRRGCTRPVCSPSAWRRGGERPQQPLRAVWPVCQGGPCAHQSHNHRASCSWLLCCNSGVPVRRGGCSLRPPPPLDWREERPEAAQSGALILMGFLPPHPRTGGLAGQPGASSWDVAVTGSRS